MNAVSLLKQKFNEIKGRIPYLELDGISDTYFVFDQNVLYFHSTKTPSFQYALWDNYDGTVTYMGEHKELIDKFKPSRTPVSTKDVEEFIKDFKLIEADPVQAFVASLCDFPFHFPAYEEDKYGYICGYQAIYDCERDEKFQDFFIDKDEFIQKEFREYWGKKRKRQQEKQAVYWKMLKDIPESFLESKLIRGVGLIDKNIEWGGHCSPRYDLCIVVDIRYAMQRKIGNDAAFAEIDRIQDQWNSWLREQDFESFFSHEFELIPIRRFFTSTDKLSRCRYKWVKERPKKIRRRERMLKRLL